MSKNYYDNFEDWKNDNNLSEEDLEEIYKRVKLRRNIYFFLCPILAPFWLKALFITKQIKYRSLDVEPIGIAKMYYGLCFIGTGIIYPYIMTKIINRTYWGMGINGYMKKKENVE